LPSFYSAVLESRPSTEALESIFSSLLERLSSESLNLPLLENREVGKVTLVAMSGDRGLCGGYNAQILKMTELRIRELKAQGFEVDLVTVGNKASTYFNKRPTPVVKSIAMGQSPESGDAEELTEFLMAHFLAGETDSVEVIYTRFVSLIASTPSIRTMLPLSPRGIEMEGDEVFQLTTKEGKFALERESSKSDKLMIARDMVYEQDPVAILNSILPLYLTGQIFRMLVECVASELAARMTAMGAASDNAKELKKDLFQVYQRARQTSVTTEIMEIVAGAAALGG
jgi:F-type H+-transporting ATPase subunit gamma